MKGEVEGDLLALGYPSVTILRPSLLLGERDEHRLGERIAAHLGWLMPPRYKPIQASVVANALVELARADTPGVQIVESRSIR